MRTHHRLGTIGSKKDFITFVEQEVPQERSNFDFVIGNQDDPLVFHAFDAPR
jgi:hypothetical protein